MNTYILFKLFISVTAIHSDLTQHKNYHLLDHGEDCGMDIRGSILGGENAELGQYTWMALLAFTLDDTLIFNCGGSVISKRYILTAAHCVLSHTDALILLLGEYNLDEDPDCAKGICAPPVQKIRPEDILSHRSYNYAVITSTHDIALVRTAADIQFNDFVHPICLPLHGVTLSDNTAEVAGWGTNDISGTVRNTPILQRLRVEIVPQRKCWLQVQDGQICAAASQSKDACSGDSGGPLFKALSHPVYLIPRYFLIGVLSYGGSLCGYTRTPMTVYTNVTDHMNWILDNIKL